MNHRPYPDPSRALRQLGRHHPPRTWHPSPLALTLAGQASTALATAGAVLRPIAEALHGEAPRLHPAAVEQDVAAAGHGREEAGAC